MTKWKMVDLKSQHFACVYKLVFPNGKIYIGKSKDIGKRVGLYERKTTGDWEDEHDGRLYDDLKVFGLDSIGVEVLFKVIACNGVDSERDLDYALGIVEMRWIKELGSSNPDVGYNATDGGEMFGIRRMEKIKEVEKEKVVYKDVLVERRHQTLGVPVVGYDINGNYIGEWESRVAFTREVIDANGALGFGQWRKGFIMYPKEEPIAQHVESYAEYIERTRAAEIEAKKVLESKVGRLKVLRDVRYTRGVVITDYNFEEVGRYDNIRDAAEETGLRYSGIYTCLKNGYGSVGGYHAFWSDEWDDDRDTCIRNLSKNKVAAKNPRVSKYGKVYQYDLCFNEVCVFESPAEAAAAMGCQPSGILAAAKKGGRAFAAGFHWRCEADRIVKEEDKPEPHSPPSALLSQDDF